MSAIPEKYFVRPGTVESGPGVVDRRERSSGIVGALDDKCYS